MRSLKDFYVWVRTHVVSNNTYNIAARDLTGSISSQTHRGDVVVVANSVETTRFVMKKESKARTPIKEKINVLIKNSSLAQASYTDQVYLNCEEDLMSVMERYSAYVKLPNNQHILIRPILSIDKYVMKKKLSDGSVCQQSLNFRFNTTIPIVSNMILDYLCNVDHDCHLAFSVFMECDEKYSNGSSDWDGVGCGRIIQDRETPDMCEWSMLVIDKAQGIKVGGCLLYFLSHLATSFSLSRMMAVVHSDNYTVLHWLRKLHSMCLNKDGCLYWEFSNPISSEWIEESDTRLTLEKAAKGMGSLKDCLKAREFIRSDIRRLCQPPPPSN